MIISIQYLDPFQNTKYFLRAYSKSPFHGDFKNGIIIELSCRNDGEIWWWGGCKNCEGAREEAEAEAGEEAGVASLNIN